MGSVRTTSSRAAVIPVRLSDEQWEQCAAQLANRIEYANKYLSHLDLGRLDNRHKVFGVWFALWAEQSAVALDRLPRDMAYLELLLQCRGSNWDAAVASLRRVIYVWLKCGVSPLELELPHSFVRLVR